MSVSIEGISLEYFSASHHYSPFLAIYDVSRRAVYHYFLSDDIKQDTANMAAHSK